MADETLDGTRNDGTNGAAPSAQPAVLVVCSGSRPLSIALPAGERPLVLGRGTAGGALHDERLSRRHVEIAHRDGTWTVRDLQSRNGTHVDGEALAHSLTTRSARVVRAGDTVFALVNEHRDACRVEDDSMVVGSALGIALERVDAAARARSTLVITGESGTGKELAARRFHARGTHASGPFVAVNCAAIPEGVAERLLFGTKRGAYSGADADARGHVQAAHGGVLFLDEVAELDLHVQAKLLRFLETREVLPLGASQPQTVDVRVCVATHRDLRQAVASGAFRADLYHRLAPPVVELPSLRERQDEIAWHVMRAIASMSTTLTMHPRLVEACLLRRWPGNVRELVKETQQAAVRALDEGVERVRADHLDDAAGRVFDANELHQQGERASGVAVTPARDEGPSRSHSRHRSYTRWSATLTREQIERVLVENDGRVSDAARSLGMQRTQLYREMARWAMKPMRTTA